jgi:hypothetical protein
MGTASSKKKAMRSIRSGIKKLELVKANLAVLKKLILLFIIILIIGCEAPSHIIETTTTDSTGKQVHTIIKYYSSLVIPQASINIASTPWLYNGYNFYNGYNYPYFITAPVYRQQVIVPTRHEYHYTQNPVHHYTPSLTVIRRH